jgi:hypothetical protein
VVWMGQPRAFGVSDSDAHARVRRFADVSGSPCHLPSLAQAVGICRIRRLSILPVAWSPRIHGSVMPIMRIAPRLCGLRATPARWPVRLSGMRTCGLGEIVTVAFLGLQIAPLPPLTRRGPMRGN